VHSEIEWEEIVSLARRIDRGVASHQGIDADGVLRLARAVMSFQRRVTAKAGRTLERGPAENDGQG
jgi:hypothetical protein